MSKSWLASNTFHYSRFSDLGDLVDAKHKKGLKISLCLPTLNEEKTIAKEIGLSEATVRTRLNRLIQQEYIQIVAVSNPIKLGFKIVGNIRIHADS